LVYGPPKTHLWTSEGFIDRRWKKPGYMNDLTQPSKFTTKHLQTILFC